MRSRGSFLVAVALVLSVVLAAPALAEQLQAKEEPQVSDNLESLGRKCATEKDEHDGVVVAVLVSCQRFYLLDPDSETVKDRDYGAFWLQSTIDPKPGWCVTSGSSDVVFPGGVKIVSKAPAGGQSANKPKRLRTAISVDADGNTETPGSIAQTSRLYPDKQTPSVKRTEKATKYRLAWSGSSGEKIALVSGVQISWPTDEGPPSQTRFGMRRYSLVEKDPC